MGMFLHGNFEFVGAVAESYQHEAEAEALTGRHGQEVSSGSRAVPLGSGPSKGPSQRSGGITCHDPEKKKTKTIHYSVEYSRFPYVPVILDLIQCRSIVL